MAADTPDQSTPTVPQPTSKAERDRRSRVLKKGKIIFQNGLRSTPCIVRNISDGGALLHFETAFLLPQHFELHIDLEDFEVTCERRWEDGLKCGVQFISEKRRIGKVRAQTLKTSEEALTPDADPTQETLDTFFQRRVHEAPVRPPQPIHRPRPSGPTKPTFGKRR